MRQTLPAHLMVLALAVTSIHAQDKTWNAALPKYGATISVIHGPDIFINGSTPPENTFDHNGHSRMVVTGVPYTFRIELMDRFPIAEMAFAHSDYTTELGPKELVVKLDDGAELPVTLELQPSKGSRGLQWQSVPIGKDVQVIEVTIKSNHEAKNGWGGLAEIAALTTTDLDAKLAIPDYDPNAPEFVNVPPFQEGTARPVQLPPRAKPNVWPRGMMTPEERDALKLELTKPRGEEALAALLGKADEALAITPEFPDPKGPMAQMKDRGDDLAKAHSRLAYDCGTLGIAYGLTGNAAYAEAAKARLLGYAERYVDYPEHRGVNRNDSSKVFAQRLSEAMWLIPLIKAYDQIHDTLTPEEQVQIETGLIRPAVTLIRGKEPAQEAAARTAQNADWRTTDPYTGQSKTLGNWTNFYNFATVMAGAVMQDQDYIDLAAADLRYNIAVGIGSDGMWGEGAIGYQFFALQAMIPAMDVAARHGIDLWGYQHNRAKLLFDSPLRYVYPDGTGAGINDSGRAKLGNWSTMVYDYAWLRWHDPRHAVMVNSSPRQLQCSEAVYFPTMVYDELPEPQHVSYPSTVFQNLGYGILRDDAKFALLDYGPHGGTHGHLDKLNLILFSGDELGGEPRFHRYEDSLHPQWTRQTVAHNTMAVAERSQQPGTGKLLQFTIDGDTRIMRAEAAGLFPGVLLDRTVVVLPEAIVDIYHGRAARKLTWDRTMRFHGTLEGLELISPDAPALGTRDGYQHLKLAARNAATELSQRTWETPGGVLHVTITGAPGQELLTVIGPDGDNIALARQQGTSADFAMVYQMDRWGPAVADVTLEKVAGAVVCSWVQGGKTRRVTVSHDTTTWSAEALPVTVED